MAVLCLALQGVSIWKFLRLGFPTEMPAIPLKSVLAIRLDFVEELFKLAA
jgi:hypothetical protein